MAADNGERRKLWFRIVKADGRRSKGFGFMDFVLSAQSAISADEDFKRNKMRKKPLYERIRQILESARTGMSRTVNTTQVVANWLVGREIVEDEQAGSKRARYGGKLLEEISRRLKKEYGAGYSVDNLELFRRFYLEYRKLISDAASRKLENPEISDTPSRKSGESTQTSSLIRHTLCDQSWRPGLLHPNLSWSLYRHLVRVESSQARAFYEIEAIQTTGRRGSWSGRSTACSMNVLL